MTSTMAQRWFWAISAVLWTAGAVLSPNIYVRIFCAFESVLSIYWATIIWRDYFAWRKFWNEEQSKGMPE